METKRFWLVSMLRDLIAAVVRNQRRQRDLLKKDPDMYIRIHGGPRVD